MPVVDLKFVVHGTGDLKAAAKNLAYINKLNVDRVSNHDFVAAANNRELKATKQLTRYEKELINIRERLNLTGKEALDLENKHGRMLTQRKTELQENIDTDKVLLQQQKELKATTEGLIKARVKESNRIDGLRDKYDSMGAATRRYRQEQLDIADAFRGVTNGSVLADRALDALTASYHEFEQAHNSGTLVDAGNQFARYGDQAYRAQQRTKRFASVGLQQAGYQVNDFIVQIASGQNALVAFGQQGSQLAGIFGTGGAVIGAVIAAVAALGNLAYQAYKAKEGIKTLEEALSDLESATSALKDSQANLDYEDVVSQYGSMSDEIYKMRDAYIALDAAVLGSNFNSSLRAFVKEARGSIGKSLIEMTQLDHTLQQLIAIGDFIFPMFGTMYDIAGVNAGINFREGLAKELGKGVDSAAVKTFYKDLQKITGFKDEDGKDVAGIGSAGDAAKRINQFLQLIGPEAYDKLSISTQEYVMKLRTQAEAYKEMQAQLDGSAKAASEEIEAKKKLAEVLAAEVKAQTTAYEQLEAAGVKIRKAEKKAREKATASVIAAHKLQVRQLAIRLKAGLAAAAKIKDAQESAAANAAKTILGYENKIATQRIAFSKAEGKNKEAEALAVELARKVAREEIEAQYEVLRAKNGQLQLTDKQTTLMEQQVTSAQDSAEAAVELQYASERASDHLADQAREAATLRQEVERAAKAFDSMTGKGIKLGQNVEGLKERLRLLQEGKSSREAKAGGDTATEIMRVEDQIDALREENKRLVAQGATPDVSSESLTQEETKQINLLKDRRRLLLDIAAEEDKNRPAKKGQKTAGEILRKEAIAMSLKLQHRKQLIGLSEEELLIENHKFNLTSKVSEQLAGMSAERRAQYEAAILEQAELFAAREKEVAQIEKIRKRNEDLGLAMSESFGDAVTSIIDGTKSIGDAFKNMAREIIAELWNIFVIKQVTGMIAGQISGFMDFNASAYANGGVIQNGVDKAYSQGGAFSRGAEVIPFASGGVVSSPTTFSMSNNQTGLMGEAGPEAIMPLKRSKNGKLGVYAEVEGQAGDTVSNVVIHQNFNFTANGDESVKKIISEHAPSIAAMTKKQILDDRRRGGQMKQAFG